MLSPAQVIPFLQHEDPKVRRHAADYLIHAHDPSPATCDDLWSAYDRFAETDAPTLLRGLAALPQTESSYQRLINAVRTETDPDRLATLQEVFEELDYGLLVTHRDEVLAAEQVRPDVRDHLRERLELSNLPVHELWDRLMAHGKDVGEKNVGEFDIRVSWRLIQALSPHTQFAGERALGVLQDKSVEDWREIFCVDLVGLCKYAPAVDTLIDKYLIDADVLRESVGDALVRLANVDGADVVDKLAAFIPGKPWDARLYAIAPFERIKRPDSERAVLRLLETEESSDLATDLGAGLCMLCTTEGLEAVRSLIKDQRYDPTMADLREMLLTVGAMTGYEPPEASRWREEIAEEEVRRAKMFPDTASLLGRLGGFLGADASTNLTGEIRLPGDQASLTAGGAFAAPQRRRSGAVAAAPGPQVRLPAKAAPKVGRNDPCPCGSGKKYKKCCLAT